MPATATIDANSSATPAEPQIMSMLVPKTPVPVAAADARSISYVLDTNVLLHDPTALFRFAEHDVHLPIAVIEELDAQKKGLEDLARNAREVTRQIALLIGDSDNLTAGIPLKDASNGAATGKLFLANLPAAAMKVLFEKMGLVEAKADNQILATAEHLSKSHSVVLVTKDVNLRVKALALGIKAQDYRTDRIVSDTDLMTPGYLEVGPSFWADNAAPGENAFYREGRGPRSSKARVTVPLAVNSYIVDIANSSKSLWRVESSTEAESVLHLVQSWRPKEIDAATPPAKRGARSRDADRTALIVPRDPFQSIALDLLDDQNLDAVSLIGKAGTGKTLLALSAGLEQTRAGIYSGIIITRATVAVGDDIGFLPGTEEDKMNAWLGGTLEDCLEVLREGKHDKNGLREAGSLPPEISVRSMSFMRGRSFQNKFIIIDEAQNLTQRQMRTLLTRAGNGTKIVLTGNTEQIDTPYLDEASSGLVWAVRKLTGWEHGGHVILPNGSRSRLTTYIEQVAQDK